MMSVFSYITTTTPESDRFLRFSILAVFILLTNYLSVIIEPINYFGYSITCAICVLIQIAGILYVIYLVKEPKSNESFSQWNDSAADTHLTNLDDLPIKENVTDVQLSLKPPRRNVLKEFFDPSLLLEFIKLPFKKRGNNGRLIFLLLILCYYLTVGTVYIESKYYYDHSHNTYRMKKLVTSIIGACLFGVIFSKMWKFSDSMIGIWIAVFTAVSRGMFVIADTKTTSKEFYTAEVLDLFSILRIIPIKCIASSISEGDGKLFSFFGILEAIFVFIYPRIFVPVLSVVIDSFENLMLLFIELFYVPNVLILFACYFLIRRRSVNLAYQS
ncbi:uncharacterized protein LOC133837996 isoform X1 [Drosophila sulfurigaster albostrigata]|uniref:uncharacterized protein LOC133837996 isoform X1 n=2 Tax=Drosophila sulfurigaster albostrigata TaxID=89887 RepID=UPI002D21E04E|nr:uncharacterized protein LOC133837996 isoform X1 [Drosophila sulfurigaster albostrigata]